MPKIKVLPQEIVNLIAAGEVVDRPSSVVKELIENSIDAMSSRIVVEIKGDGRHLIRVVDDGIGMTEEDAILAFERHATSKIFSHADLEHITTLGFRGEALPSIASVSNVELITRSKEDELATCIRVSGGKIVEVEKTTRQVGTTVTVTNLFYNAPARAKFLKSRSTEIRHITRTFATHAISHYWISMKLVRDRKTILSLPSVESVEERIGGILGKSFGETSIPIDFSDEYIRLAGFLSRPEDARATTGLISIFVNRRPVESRTILRAICEAYGTLLKRNRYPTGVIMIEIDPAEVDFNIHPAKKQVKFRRESDVWNFVKRAVQSALTSKKMIPPLLKADKKVEPPLPTKQASLLSKEKVLVAESKRDYTIPQPEEAVGVVPIVQLKNSYILAQSNDEFYLIDQHAAHERVLYEEARANLEGQPPVVQKLLFGETINVTPEEEEVIDENIDQIRKMGFDIRKFGKRTYVVEAIPVTIKESARTAILVEIVDDIIESRSKGEDMKHLLAAAFACKAAIKAGERLSDEEVASLIERLFSTRMPFACPHGRPTMIRFSWEEIERRFLRR